MTFKGVRLTCTGDPHDGGEHAVLPVTRAEIKLSVQLAQVQRLRVEREILPTRRMGRGYGG